MLSYYAYTFSSVVLDFGQGFERAFSIPGEVAILECPLQVHYLFNPAETPYSVTWYDERTGSEITALEQSVMLKKTQVWFFNVTMQQQGKYTCVVRTQSECYKQATGLVVTEMTSEDCERPQRGLQRISAHVNDLLVCPLRKYLKSVDSPSIQWYKNCELLQEDKKFVPNEDMLNIRKVHLDDAGFYTCKMTFRVAGVVREMAETIECEVKGEHLLHNGKMMCEHNDNLLKTHSPSVSITTFFRALPGSSRCFPAVVDVVQDALSRCRRLLLLYTASSLCSPEAQEWAEQQTGLYRALVENSMRIVLLELEEIREPLRLPHSVCLLKDKQGALQAWKRRKRWAFCNGKSEERVSSLKPSPRFWREVRYHMPVRGKAKERNWFSF
uniref:Interleukin-1 receptor type 1-like n=1 Tax=Sinocyclocheilus grahami TaxID=75366 RepID=A0A672MQ27_SINGR